MAIGLLDTSIIVDVLRGYLPAIEWFSKQERIGISPVVVFELIEGTQNKLALNRALKQIEDIEVVEVTASDLMWVRQQLIQYHLSHNVDTFDCLIAASAHRLQMPLYTRNLKHFSQLLGNLAIRPY